MHLLIFSNEKKKISSKLKRRRNVFSTCLINSNDWSDLQRCILVCFRICGDKKISKAGVEEDIQEIRIKGDGLHREPRKNDISSIRSYPNHSVVFISFLSFCLFFRFFFLFWSFVRRLTHSSRKKSARRRDFSGSLTEGSRHLSIILYILRLSLRRTMRHIQRRKSLLIYTTDQAFAL